MSVERHRVRVGLRPTREAVVTGHCSVLEPEGERAAVGVPFEACFRCPDATVRLRGGSSADGDIEDGITFQTRNLRAKVKDCFTGSVQESEQQHPTVEAQVARPIGRERRELPTKEPDQP